MCAGLRAVLEVYAIEKSERDVKVAQCVHNYVRMAACASKSIDSSTDGLLEDHHVYRYSFEKIHCQPVWHTA